MAIQPIDLSTLYSQMDKVSKFNASVEQNVKMVNASNMNKTIQENLVKSQQVHEAKNEDSNSSKVRPDGKNSQQQMSGEKKSSDEKENKEEQNPVKKTVEISDPRLGQHIDITR